MSKGQKIFIGILSVLLVLVSGVTIVVASIYLDVSNRFGLTHKAVVNDRKETGVVRQRELDFGERSPFSVLLLGLDTGGEGRTEQGRSDTMILVTINPNTKKTLLTSIPRDTYAEIVGYEYDNGYPYFDKANHAYAFGGAAMTMDTVEKYLDIPIDHFIAIDFKGMEDLVNAIGGIEVYNSFSFSERKIQYDKGQLKLNGLEALNYARMRDQDPEGDYGRQKRQRQVIQAIAKKGLRLESVAQYSKILKAVSDNLTTDLSFDEIEQIALKYQDAFKNIETEQLQGQDEMLYGISYQVVQEEELVRVQNILKEQLEIPYEETSTSDFGNFGEEQEWEEPVAGDGESAWYAE